MQELYISPSSFLKASAIPQFLNLRLGLGHFSSSSVGALLRSSNYSPGRWQRQQGGPWWCSSHGCVDLLEGGKLQLPCFSYLKKAAAPLFVSCRRRRAAGKCSKTALSCSLNNNNNNRVVAPVCSQNLHWHEGCVERKVRQALLKQKGCIVWMTGLSGSGKSTLACTLDHCLVSMGHLSYVLDGDNIRHGLSSNLGFSAADREENIRRVGEVAKLFADVGIITLVSFISPYAKDREFVRRLVPNGEFIEVFMKVPLEVCEGRDCKGLYKLARAGVLKGFTGVDDPYEEPQNPEIVLEATNGSGDFISAELMASTLIAYLRDRGFLVGPCSGTLNSNGL